MFIPIELNNILYEIFIFYDISKCIADIFHIGIRLKALRLLKQLRTIQNIPN